MAAIQKAMSFSLVGVIIPGENSMNSREHIMKAIMNNGM